MTFEYDQKIKKTFCPLAWNHSYINLDGAFHVCCMGHGFNNIIKTDSGENAYLQSGISSSEVMNTQYMKKLRLKMLQGEWPSVCKKCEDTEKAGALSRRNLEIKAVEAKIEEMLSQTKDDGTTSYNITSTDYRLGNLCNLQCRMCNPRSTKLWINDWNKIVPERERVSDAEINSFKKYDWIFSDELLKDVEEKAPYLEHIQFAGGEPLLIPTMSKILKKCIASGHSKKIILTYITNLTVLPKEVLELWKHFRGVKILASIDAVGDLNHYIRFPSRWEEIDKNLKFIDEHHEDFNIKECMLNTTVQALNLIHLDRIYHYLEGFKFIVKLPNIFNLRFPSYLATTLLPPALKKIAAIKLIQIQNDYQAKTQNDYSYLLENIVDVLHFMYSRDGFHSGEFQEFKDFQKKFDQLNGLNLSDFAPEFDDY